MSAVIITGAGRGIGAATARRLARAGRPVCVNYRSDDASADALVAELRRCGAGAIAVKGDVSKESVTEGLFAAAERELGPITGLVNNAGIPGRIGRVADLEIATLRHVLDVNVVACVLCARSAVRHMSTRHGGAGGAIVNLSSMAAVTGSPGELVHYAAAKGAVESFTRGLAREVATEGIRVNAVAPGLIDTDIHGEAGDAERIGRYATRMPMQRAGHADEVAAAIVWLLSDESSYVTAAVLPVAGGR